ncbi:MAG: hypothetical protein RI911_450, partial [Candidatus Parcubacteria bacterium]
LSELTGPRFSAQDISLIGQLEQGFFPVTVHAESDLFSAVDSLDRLGYVYALASFFDDQVKGGGNRYQFSFAGHEPGKASLDAFKEAIAKIDIIQIVQTGKDTLPSPQIVERTRLMLNSLLRQEGDKMVIMVAGQFLKGKDGGEHIEQLVRFGEQWAEYSTTLRSGQRDISGIYKLVSNFAFGKAAGLLGDEKVKLSQEVRDRVTPLVLNAGFTIDVRESNLMKGLKRVVTDPAGTAGKAYRKLAGAQQDVVSEVGTAPYERTLSEGTTVQYVCTNVRTCAPESADMMLLRSDPNFVQVELFTNRDGKIDRDAIERERAGRMIVTFPVTFTSGPRKLTDLAAYRGEMMSWLLRTDGNDGMVLATSNGMMGIVNKQRILVSELKAFGVNTSTLEQAGKTELSITRSFEDFQLFVELVRRERLSLQTNMLLLADGVQMPVGGDSLDSRRLLLTFPDGTIGMLSSFTQAKKISTNTAVALAAKLGARHAVYCDTGMYDFAQVYDVTGATQTIGWADNKDSTNLAVFTTRRAPANPR